VRRRTLNWHTADKYLICNGAVTRTVLINRNPNAANIYSKCFAICPFHLRVASEKLVSSIQTSFHKTAYVSIVRNCTCQMERKLFPVARKNTLISANVGAYFLPYAQHVNPLLITAARFRHLSLHALTFPDTYRSCSVWTGYTIPKAGIAQSVHRLATA